MIQYFLKFKRNIINIISEKQIEVECNSIYRPLTIEAATTILPFNQLGDREFDLLSYLLVSSELKTAWNDLQIFLEKIWPR